MRSSEAGAQGAAILAGVGAGIYDSAETTSKRVARVNEILQPDPNLAALYQVRLDEYEFLHKRMREVYGQLKHIAEDQGQ